MKIYFLSSILIFTILMVPLYGQKKPDLHNTTNTTGLNRTNSNLTIENITNYYYSIITDFFSSKNYEADIKKYTTNDLKVPFTNAGFVEALTNLNISYLTLLRNEVFARHGYSFSSDYLKKTLTKTSWYKPSSILNMIKDFNNNENWNMGYIQSLEKIDKKGEKNSRQLAILLNLQKTEMTADEIMKVNQATGNSNILTNE